MAAMRLRKNLSRLKRRHKAPGDPQRLAEGRRLHLEPLEDRRLMAVGPALVAIIPNSGVFLQNNTTLTVAPRDMTFRFAQGNVIDAVTLLNDPAILTDDGIQLIRAGGDGTFGAGGSA